MKEIKMEVTFTDGYEKRFTEACLKQMGRSDDTRTKDDGDQSRAAIPKRKQHRQRVKAAKKAVKEFLVLTGIGIALGLAFLYALDSDTYEPPKPEPRMIKAIGGDYYYPEDQYDEYLKERAAYIEQEEKDESYLLQSRTSTEDLGD